MNPCMIYITAPGMEEAEKISRALLEEKLVACVNILDGMKSMYWWQGKIESASEVVLIAKTRESLVDRAIEKVKSLHSYDCPCIVSLPIQKGNKDFLEWLDQETQFRVV